MQRRWRGLGIVLTGLLLASCQTGGPPANFTPDPKLRTASARELEDGVWRACLRTQSRRSEADQQAVSRGCRCYARGTLGAFTPAETAFYRQNGYFDASGQAKGFAALDSCGLPRPT